MATSPLTLFPTFPYTPALLAHIGSTRARTPTLLVDHLLALAGITLLYPPRDEPALLLLLQAVEDSAFDRLKRDCILFYLLKDLDWDPSATSSSSSSAAAAAVAAGAGKEEDTEMDEDEVEDLVVPTPAEEFAQRRRIPVAYRLSMHALWLLDHGLPSRAITYLTDPRFQLDPSLTLPILTLLSPSSLPSPTSPAPSPTSSGLLPAELLSSRLTLQFLRACRPALHTWQGVEMKLVALAARDLGDAWAYVDELSTAQPSEADKEVTWGKGSADEHLRLPERAAKRLVEWCFIPRPRPTPIRALLSLPLPPPALPLLTALSLHPPPTFPPSSLPILHTLLHTRLIQSGHYARAAALDTQFAQVLASRGVADRLSAESAKIAGEAARGRKAVGARLAKALPRPQRERIEGATARVVVDFPLSSIPTTVTGPVSTPAAGPDQEMEVSRAPSADPARPEPLSSSLGSKLQFPQTPQRARLPSHAANPYPPGPGTTKTPGKGAPPMPTKPRLPPIVPFARRAVASPPAALLAQSVGVAHGRVAQQAIQYPTSPASAAGAAAGAGATYPQPSAYLRPSAALDTSRLGSSPQTAQSLGAKDLQKRKREMERREWERDGMERVWEDTFGAALLGNLNPSQPEQQTQQSQREVQEAPRKRGKRAKGPELEELEHTVTEEDRLTSVEGSVKDEHEPEPEAEHETKAGKRKSTATGRKSRTPTTTPRRKTRARGGEEVPPVPSLPAEHEHEHEHEEEHEPKLPGAFDPPALAPAPTPSDPAPRGRKRPAPVSPPAVELETPRATRRKTRAASLIDEHEPSTPSRRRTRRGASEDPDALGTPGRSLRRSHRLSAGHLQEGVPPVPAISGSASMGSLSALAGARTPRASKRVAGTTPGRTPGTRRGFRAESVSTEDEQE